MVKTDLFLLHICETFVQVMMILKHMYIPLTDYLGLIAFTVSYSL